MFARIGQAKATPVRAYIQSDSQAGSTSGEV